MPLSLGIMFICFTTYQQHCNYCHHHCHHHTVMFCTVYDSYWTSDVLGRIIPPLWFLMMLFFNFPCSVFPYLAQQFNGRGCQISTVCKSPLRQIVIYYFGLHKNIF